MVDTKEIIKSAIQAAHISGVQALSKEQFDALFLSARGMGAMKQKYHDNLLGLQSALMQEDIFEMIGIPLDAEYLKQKKALQKERFANKSELSDSQLKQKESEFSKEIESLRNEFQVDKFINEQIHVMVNNPIQYNQKRDGFSEHLSMGFVEEDMDVKVKFAHESDAEFKLKQDINKLLKGDEYNSLRGNYARAKEAIEEQYEHDRQALEQTISEPIDVINSKAAPKLEDARKKVEMLEKYYPKAAVKENNLLKLETVRQAFVSTEAKYKALPNHGTNEAKALQKKFEKLSIEKVVLFSLDNNQDKYEDMMPEQRQEALFQAIHSDLTEKKQALESDKTERVSAIREPIQAQLQALKDQRLKDVLALKKDKKYKAELKEADEYFDKNILPWVKELKAQEAHKYFVVLNKKMQELLTDNVAELEQVDSNTIGFVGLLGELMSDLTKLGALHHIGIKTAETFINEEAKSVDVSKEGVVQGLLERAAKKVSKKVGKELGQCVSHKEVFTQHLEHMEQYAQLQVPKHIAEEFEPKSFTEYLPDVQKKSGLEQEDNIPDSIFDVIEQFNKSKGFLKKMDTAKSVYQAITSAKSGSTFFNDEPNTAQVFVSALKDEALAFNYHMLEQVSVAIETLDKNKVLDNIDIMDNGGEWKALLSNAKTLEEDKRTLDTEFQSLCSLHQTQRAAYIEIEGPHKAAKEQLSQYVEQHQTLSEALARKMEENDQAKEALYAKELPKDERERMTNALDALEKKHDTRLDDSWYQGGKEKHEAAHEQRLQEADEAYQKAIVNYDKETEEDVEDIIKNAYGNAKASNFKLFATKKDLEKFRTGHPEIEIKINEYKKQRQLRKKEGYPPILAKAKAESENQLVADMTKLVAEYGNKKLKSQKSKSSAKNEILSAQKKVDAKVDAMYVEQHKLEAKLESLDGKIEEQKSKVESSEKELIIISREFYTSVNAFNEHKTSVNKQAQVLLKEAFTLNTGNEPHLRALQSMFESSHMKVGAIALASDKFLPTIVDGVSTQLMTYDDVANKVLERREVKEVMKTGDEKGLADKAKDNLVQFGAKSIVEAVSGQAVKAASAFVNNLDATVKAEQAFDVDQKTINARAEVRAEEIAKKQEINIEDIDQTPVTEPVVVNAKKKGFLKTIGSFFGGIFSAIRDAFRSGKEEDAEMGLGLEEIAHNFVGFDEEHIADKKTTQEPDGNALSQKPITPAAQVAAQAAAVLQVDGNQLDKDPESKPRRRNKT